MNKSRRKNPYNVKIGRLGGTARAKVLEPARRSAIARLAAHCRWAAVQAKQQKTESAVA